MLVSIIIPAYNTEKYIRECIESCFRQTYQNIEIICVNDGSKDNTDKIINSMLSEDSRLKVIHQENAGVTAARMAGTKAAKGHYIFYLDSDDMITDYCIAVLMQHSENGTVDMVSGNFQIIEKNERVHTIASDSLTVKSFNGYNCFLEIFRQCDQPLYPRLIKREICLQTNTPFSIKWAEDAAMLFQIISLCKRTTYIDEIIYFLRCNPESTTAQACSEAFITQKDALQVMKKTVEAYPEYQKIKKHWLARELIWEMHSLWKSDQKGIIGYQSDLRKKIITNLLFHPSVAKIILKNQRKYFFAAILVSLISQRLAIKILKSMGYYFVKPSLQS